MKIYTRIGLVVVCLIAIGNLPAHAEPPFDGTIFIDPDIIKSTDPTTFQNSTYAGQGFRTMFDRRVNNWINVNAYLFNTTFSDGLTTEIQVNPEFGSSAAAQVEAQKYGTVIGRLPTVLRSDVETVWIHLGTQPFGGGNNNLLIHTGQAALYTADGILEETFVHEAAHTSLDADHANAPGWLAAQTADNGFISTYARNHPKREDIAESFLPYLAARYRANRISASLADTILQTIPNRIEYFNSLALDLYPLLFLGDANGDQVVDFTDLGILLNNYNQPGTFAAGDFNRSSTVDFTDLGILLNNYNQSAPTSASVAAVPEPSSLLLVCCAALGLIVAARRKRARIKSVALGQSI